MPEIMEKASELISAETAENLEAEKSQEPVKENPKPKEKVLSKKELFLHEVKANEKFWVKEKPVIAKGGPELVAIGEKLMDEKGVIDTNNQPHDIEKPEEAKQEQESKVESKELASIKNVNKELIKNNPELAGLDDLLDALPEFDIAKYLKEKNPDLNPEELKKNTEEFEKYLRDNDIICLALEDKVLMTPRLFKEFADPETGEIKKFNIEHAWSHELSHFLIRKGAIFNKTELNVLNKFVNSEEMNDQENEIMEKDPEANLVFSEIKGLVDDSGKKDDDTSKAFLIKNESKYVRDLLGDLNNPVEMQKKLTKYNELHKKDYTPEDFKKKLTKELVQELLAEKMNYYLIAKDKTNSIDMLRVRFKQCPELIETIGIKKEDSEKFKEAFDNFSSEEKVWLASEKAKSNPAKIIEKFKEKGISIETKQLDKFINVIKENDKYFNYFKKKMGAHTPDEMGKLLKAKSDLLTDFEDFDDDIGELVGGSYIGDGGSMPGSRGTSEQGGNVVDWFFEMLDLVFSGR